jgi:cell division protein FtsB
MKRSIAKAVFVTGILLLAASAIYALRGPRGLAALLDRQEQVRRLEKRNADLARAIEERRARIERLKESHSQQELEIRRRLKLVKPGEKVFILQDPPAPAPR